ncbi:MAG: class I SAM-dependent RNA methyltransferase [Butyricicoccus sp.]
MIYEFCCPTLFGLEGLVGDELRYGAKLEDVRVENGRVFFSGDEQTLIWANLWLRCAERVLIKLGSFEAHTFTELFDGVYELPWLDFIEKDYAFPVKGYSLSSDLHSVPDCQSIIKKAVVKSLSDAYGVEWFEETGPRCQIQFSIMNNEVTLYLDTSGSGLHKRGYRANANAAPLRETLAAALVKLSRYRGRGEFLDPFCGSGTIPIEAAMIAKNQAPGLMRSFDAEKWEWLPKKLWQTARKEALDAVRSDGEYAIFASDIDPDTVALAQDNARKAGVDRLLNVVQADACTLDLHAREGTLICNPPYGERMMDVRETQQLVRRFGTVAARSPMKQYIISSDESFEHFYGVKADKKRKLYNGMLKCNVYMYFQPPEKRQLFFNQKQPFHSRNSSEKHHKSRKKRL